MNYQPYGTIQSVCHVLLLCMTLFFINAGTEQEEAMIEYELSSTATGICVHCTFLESTMTECVAVVHQRISQLSPLGLINIESSHRFQRSGNTAYGCIDGFMTNSTKYRISVVGGNLTTQLQGD